MEAVICGIDPGLGTTGYAVLRCIGDSVSVVDAGASRRRLASGALARAAATRTEGEEGGDRPAPPIPSCLPAASSRPGTEYS